MNRERIITDALRRLAVEPVEPGSAITRAEAVAHRLWQLAVGDKHTPPTAWAMKLLLERLEGKVPYASEAENKPGTPDLADEVAAMAAERAKEMNNALIDDVIAGRITPRN